MSKLVWIVYASCGRGHYFPALALREKLEEKNIPCKIIDILDYNKFFKNIYSGTYKFIVKYIPYLWNYIYTIFDKPSFWDSWRIHVEKLFLVQFFSALKKENPSTVVFSHFILSEILNEEMSHQRNWFCLITDLDVHRLWINKFIDKYFVGTLYTKEKLLRYGIDSNKVEVTGIPVRKEFVRDTRTNEELSTLPYLTIFVNITIFKKSDAERLLIFLKKSPFQGFILCMERNDYYQLAKRILRKNSFKILRYREDIYKFMKESDIIITKPGGSTVAEILTMEKFPIFYDIVRGQEHHNLRVMKKYNIGKEICTVTGLVKALSHLDKHREALVLSRENIHKNYYYNPEKIIQHILGAKT